METHDAAYEFRDVVNLKAMRAEVELARKLLMSHEWEQAAAKGAALARSHPDDMHVRDLLRDLQAKREKHKTFLTQRFLQVAHRDDPDEAMSLLKRMDRMLSQKEAAPLAEIAGKVIERFKQRLINRLHIAIDLEDWIQASDVAERIVESMPNSRVAVEVGQRMPALKQRSAEQQKMLEKS